MPSLLPYLFAVIAGFSLLKAPLSGTFLASLAPVLSIIGLLSIIIFSLILIYKGVLALVGKKL